MSRRDDPAPPARGAAAIVVAAGASTRMGGTDKLAAEVAGRPLLAWTLAALARSSCVGRIVVVTTAAKVAEISAAAWLPDCVSAVVAGGVRRQDSVAAGVAALGDGPDSEVILVHDGARPMVSAALVDAIARAAAAHGAAIPVVPVADTLKRVEDGRVVGTLDRAGVMAAQTPQGVRRDVLAAAYAAFPPGGPATWTDEAALLEACRIPVHAIPGESANFKVTLPGRHAAGGVGPRPRGAGRRDGRRRPGGPGGDRRRRASVRPRLAARARGHRHRRGAAPARSFRRRRRAARRLRCAPRRGRARRPRPDLPGRTVDPGRDRERRRWSPNALPGCARPASCRAPWTSRSSAPGRASRSSLPEMRAAIAGLLGLPVDRVNVKASTREPGRLGGCRSRSLRPRRRGPRGRGSHEPPAPRHADRVDPTARADRGRSRSHLLVRPDGLRARPRRQLPFVPVRGPPRPLSPVARRSGHLGDEPHRRRRQDHPRRGGAGDRDRRARRPAHRRVHRGRAQRSG